MVSHLTILHRFLQDYVLCNGSDGHISIENVNEYAACSNTSSFTISVLPGLSISVADECKDTRLNENCIDENEFILENRTNLNVDLINRWQIIASPENLLKNYNFSDRNVFKENPILENYTTVSLLI